MKETTHQIMNHIRIMIEEVDFSNKSSKVLYLFCIHIGFIYVILKFVFIAFPIFD